MKRLNLSRPMIRISSENLCLGQRSIATRQRSISSIQGNNNSHYIKELYPSEACTILSEHQHAQSVRLNKT